MLSLRSRLLGLPLGLGTLGKGRWGWLWVGLGRLEMGRQVFCSVEGVEDKAGFAWLEDCFLNFAVAAAIQVGLDHVGDFDFRVGVHLL